MNYYDYVVRVVSGSHAIQSDTDLSFLIPATIEYSEQRLYRELDLLATRVTDSTASLSSGNRTFTLPTTTGSFVVVEQLNVISPAPFLPLVGTRNPLTFVSRDFIDASYPSNVTSTSMPLYAARISNTQVMVGPSPDASYVMEVIGTQRPTALSSTQPTTALTELLPDLFTAASMVYLAESSSDPVAIQKWQATYTQLFQSAEVEELRKRYMSQGWTNQQPSRIATPPRV